MRRVTAEDVDQHFQLEEAKRRESNAWKFAATMVVAMTAIALVLLHLQKDRVIRLESENELLRNACGAKTP